MKVGSALRGLLVADTAVGLLASGRIYPELAPEGAAMPYIVYSVVSNSPADSKDGTPVDQAQVEVYSVDDSYAGVNDLADKVRAALDRKSKTTTGDTAIVVQSVQYTNEVTEVSDDRKTYVSIQDYTFRIIR
jgi:hypothetical protein